MRIKQGLSFSLVAGLALALSACGGSGSGTTPVVDLPAPPAPPAPPTVAISGKVTDRAIANATVIVTVNGQSFQAPLPTAADGSYTVEIHSDDPDALVTTEAFDPSGTVRLSAIIDSFADMEAAADSSGAVADVNITNVTTAQQILATRLTTDGNIDSKDELVEAVSRVNTDDLLDLSAAIKVVVENIDGVVLPSDISDTLALAEAIVDGTTTFLEDVAISAPNALNTAIDLVLTDGNATMPFVADSTAGVYVSQDDLSLFAMLPAGFGFNVSHERDEVAMFDWQVTADGVLNLWFAGEEQRAESVTLLDRTRDVVNVVVRESGNNGSGQPATAWYFAFDGAFTADNVPGSYSTDNDPGHLTVFLADGTGYDSNLITGVQADAFTWEVDADGVLAMSDADGSASFARRLAGSSNDNLKLLVWERDATGMFADVSVVDVLRSDDVVSSDGSGSATALLLAGNTYALTEGNEVSLFTFGANGSITQISQYAQDQNSWFVGESRGEWSVTDSGTITTLFPGDNEAGSATVLQGLGEDFMTVQTSEDGETVVQQVLRVIALDAALVVGSFSIVDESTGVATETVHLADDFTGIHVGEDGVAEDFSWGISSDGRLVVETAGNGTFDREDLTFYLLAGSGGDLLRFVMVQRVNGALRAYDPSSGESPRTMSVVTMIRSE